MLPSKFGNAGFLKSHMFAKLSGNENLLKLISHCLENESILRAQTIQEELSKIEKNEFVDAAGDC